MTLRRWAAWCVAIPLMLVGSQVAHGLAYRIAYPQFTLRIHMLGVAGHGYAAQLPLVLGLLGSVAVCVLIWVAVDAVRGGTSRPLPPLAFAVLPLAGFTLQEFVERWLAVGGLPWWMVMQPTFRIGLLLQLPFGLAAYLVALLLLRTAHQLGRRAGPAPPPRGLPERFLQPRRPGVDRPRTTISTFGASTRGPPLPVA